MEVVGYFSNHKSANEAVQKLKEAGFDKAYVDLNDHYVDYMDVRTNLPGTERGPSLSGLVLEADEHAISRGKAPIGAADPMVSGMGTFEEIADVNRKVIVEAEPEKENEVKSIIASMGGNFDNPNIKIPEKPENINMY